MLCAWTAEPSRHGNGNSAAASAIAARRAVIRQFARSWTMGPRPVRRQRGARPYGAATARLTIFSPCSLLIRPATSSLPIALLPNCSAEHAALGAVDDRGLVVVEQRRDIGDARLRREPHQRVRRRAAPPRSRVMGPARLVHAQRRGLERGGLVLHQHRADHAGLQQQRQRAEARRPGQRPRREAREKSRDPGGEC